MTPHQPPLDLPFPRRRAMGRGDFVVSPANAKAAALVGDPAGWPDGRLAVIGGPGSGKTHLVHVFMAETGAARVSAAALDAAAVPSLVAAGAVAVEDGDAPGMAETALFHLLNLAAAEGCRVLLTGREAPARWPVALPDLASRLGATTVVRLEPPDDALLAAVIAKLLADRHLHHDPALPAFLAARIERSFAAAEAAVETLDAASLAERRNLTRRLAADIFAAARPDDTQLSLDLRSQTRHE
jgi:chromosomal replication initiation ATPase DnaA